MMMLKQEEELIPRKLESTNWVYMFHLPYDLDEVSTYREYIKGFVSSSFGEFEELHFNNFKDFFEMSKKKTKDPTESDLVLQESL